jgi:hypothetical protein
MYLRLSKAVSVVLHPFLVPLYMVSLLLLAGTVYSLYPLKVKIYLIWVTLLFTTIIPVLVIALLKSYRKIGDADLSDRKERFIPLLAMIACYTLCAVAIARIPSAQMLSRFMFAGACCVADLTIRLEQCDHQNRNDRRKKQRHPNKVYLDLERIKRIDRTGQQ